MNKAIVTKIGESVNTAKYTVDIEKKNRIKGQMMCVKMMLNLLKGRGDATVVIH